MQGIWGSHFPKRREGVMTTASCVFYSLEALHSCWNVLCISVGTEGSLLELETLQQKGNFLKIII